MEKEIQQICLRVPKSVNKKLCAKAKEKGMTKTGFLLMLIDNEFRQESFKARDKPCDA